MSNWNLLFRRSHLYLGLLLLPWTILYAVSTFYFNHGKAYGHGARGAGEWRTLWEKNAALEVPASDEALRETARRVLEENHLSGPFGVQKQGGRLVINLPRFLTPARLTFDPVASKLKAEERMESSMGEIFARLHTRTGYNRGGALSVVWAVLVDVYCFATLLWIVTGLYLWWKLAFTRAWGMVAIAGGIVSIVVLLWSA